MGHNRRVRGPLFLSKLFADSHSELWLHEKIGFSRIPYILYGRGSQPPFRPRNGGLRLTMSGSLFCSFWVPLIHGHSVPLQNPSILETASPLFFSIWASS